MGELRELPEDEGLYRLLVDAITDYAIYMLDPNGFIVSWNSGAQRLKGYDTAEILGQNFSRFYTPEDRAVDLPARALAIAAGEGRFESQGWRMRKDGTRFWAHVVIDPVRSPQGTIIGFAKITRDLTEQRRADEALRKSEQRFSLLVQSVTDYAIYMLDTEGYITNWNAGAQRIKGYRPNEIVGEHFSRFYTEEDRATGEPQRGLATALSEGRFEKEGWRLRKDGTRFMASVVIDPIRDETGQHIGFAKVTRDITERYQAQKALEQAREAFFQSQKMEALGQLTGGIAHDFNNLLMAILSSLELLRKRVPEDPRIDRLIGNAMQGAERGKSLTRRMLAFARRQDLNPEAVDVPGLVTDMMDLLERSLGPSVGIERRFANDLPLARADANQLELALLNLAVNARDAMPGGGIITIEAQLRHLPEGHADGLMPGHYICLSVTDTGEGMDAQTLQKATEPFFTTKGVGKGTGLGLSMVHGMAAQSGGRLMLSSQKGLGTRAEIWLPLADPQTPVRADADAETTAAPATAPKRRVILVVDDDILVLVNIAAMLEDMGHSVIQAGSGQQALERVDTTPRLDLVITDQAMPTMTGTQLARAIRARRPNLPVVLATGFADVSGHLDPDLPRLGKPFEQADLARLIGDVLDGD